MMTTDVASKSEEMLRVSFLGVRAREPFLQVLAVWSMADVRSKFVPYGWTIASSLITAPSSIIFMSLFAPSRYESKLWDLKRLLKSKDKDNAEAIKKEFVDIQLRYSSCTSRWFDKVLLALAAEGRLDKLDQKYMCFTKAAIDWELIRVQPIRYVWNETEQIALYGLLLSAALATNQVLKRGIVAVPEEQLVAFTHVRKRLWSLHIMQSLAKAVEKHRGWRQNARYGRWYNNLCSLPGKMRYPIMWCNVLNFGWLMGGYKAPPRRED